MPPYAGTAIGSEKYKRRMNNYKMQRHHVQGYLHISRCMEDESN